jgi:hypothetical protein
MLAPHAGAHTERDSLSKKQLISAKNVALHFCESDTPQQAKSMTYLTSPRSNCRRWVRAALESLHEVVDFSLRVSLALNGQPTTRQGEFASIEHAKISINGTSIEQAAKGPLFDHSAIISLSRMIMEGGVLFHYLLEAVPEDEWKCRYLCLRLHDTTNRIKLMRGLQQSNEHIDLRNGKEQLKKELQQNTFFKSLPEERSKNLLSGEHFYIRGVNAAVEKSGWNTEKYLALYSYFSSHAHSAPMSFFRVREHNVSFSDPSEAQSAATVTALSVAEYSLLKATLLHLNSSPQNKAKFRSEELLKMDQVLAGWKSRFER